MFTCPVCFFDGLEEPAEDYNICDCCGTEFGSDDEIRTFAELRSDWIAKGANWFFRQPPLFWNPWRQLSRVGEVLPYSAVTYLDSSLDSAIGPAPHYQVFSYGSPIAVGEKMHFSDNVMVVDPITHVDPTRYVGMIRHVRTIVNADPLGHTGAITHGYVVGHVSHAYPQTHMADGLVVEAEQLPPILKGEFADDARGLAA